MRYDQVYDYSCEHSKETEGVSGDVSEFTAIVNIAKFTLGVGILASPWACMQVGIVLGTVGIILVALANLYTMHI